MAGGNCCIRAHAKELAIRWVVQPDLHDDYRADPGRLRQVIFNLVGNAIKFTERGEVVLEVGSAAAGDVSIEPQNAHDRRLMDLVFAVRDTGIGISPDKFQRIFQRFEQVDTSATRRFGGTGLGLPISQGLVRLMGGANLELLKN